MTRAPRGLISEHVFIQQLSRHVWISHILGRANTWHSETVRFPRHMCREKQLLTADKHWFAKQHVFQNISSLSSRTCQALRPIDRFFPTKAPLVPQAAHLRGHHLWYMPREQVMINMTMIMIT